MDLRICNTCKLSFPNTREFFPFHSKAKNTFNCRCHTCQSIYRKQHYKNNVKHIKEVNYTRKEKIDKFVQELKSAGCKICGEPRHWVLDFHHRNFKDKQFEMSVLIKNGAINKLLKESQKCDILCANCHRDLHYKERKSLK